MHPYQIVITRTHQNDSQTVGNLEVYTDRLLFVAKTLELPWKGNQRNISRIPSKHYEAVKHISRKHGKSIWIRGVENRSEILIHKGNFNSQTKGCILIGEDLIDIDGDGHKDVTNSEQTMNELYDILREPLWVNVVDEFEIDEDLL